MDIFLAFNVILNLSLQRFKAMFSGITMGIDVLLDNDAAAALVLNYDGFTFVLPEGKIILRL